MRTLLIDTPSGAAGDMLLGGLLACGGDRDRLERELLGLGCGPIRIRATTVQAGSLAAIRVDVDAEQEARWIPAPAGLRGGSVTPPSGHDHRPYAAIRDLIAKAGLPERVAVRAQRVFRLLAEAEGAVHGVPADAVEFHEVGSLDAIADIVGCALLLEQLGIDRVVAGPIVPGHGTVRCAHGMMPVPVPAVAELLKRTGAPVRLHGTETGELTTPTGCALICGLADAFLGACEPMLGTVSATGFGAGHKTIPGLTNALRCTIIDTSASTPETGDQVVELAATIDDMTGEDLGAAVATLLAAGALDAWLTPVVMKKGRPGHVLTVLAVPADQRRLGDLILCATSTIGLRLTPRERRVLPRRTVEVVVRGQRIRLKVVTQPDGRERAKPESDDVQAAATVLSISPDAVRRLALAAWEHALRSPSTPDTP